jgi:hypothetical protein
MIHQESGRSWVMGWWWNTNKQSNQPLDLVPILTSSACCWLYTCLIKKLSHYFHPPSKEEKQSVPWSNSTRLYSGSRHSCSSLIHLILHNGYLLYCFPFLSLSLPLLRYGPFNQVAYNIVVSQNVGISRTELFVIDAWKSASQSHWSFNRLPRSRARSCLILCFHFFQTDLSLSPTTKQSSPWFDSTS